MGPPKQRFQPNNEVWRIAGTRTPYASEGVNGPLSNPANSAEEVFIPIVPINTRVFHVLLEIVQEMLKPQGYACVSADDVAQCACLYVVVVLVGVVV